MAQLKEIQKGEQELSHSQKQIRTGNVYRL